jgi:GH15 family glucan-1,4-alpha-glucosidase
MATDVNPLDQTVRRSRELLREAQDPSGAWPAAPGFAPYGFSWFRDGAFIAEGASAAGLRAEADAFHRWCAAVLVREEPAVAAVVEAVAAGRELPDEAYLPARYRLDGSRQVDDWWNFQVDGYGTWIWALERHLARTGAGAGGADVAAYADGVRVATRYLVSTGRGTCRDWWEENRDETHVTTLAGVAAGLRAAVRLGVLDPALADAATATADAAVADIRERGHRDGHLVKWLDGDAVDASLLAVAAVYDALPLDDPLVARTVGEVEQRLTTPGGGVHRYEADTFYGGGQWPILGCLLAWHHRRAGDDHRADELLAWASGCADDDGLLPEQVPPMLAPDRLGEWLERWGSGPRPLVWSHGMLLATLAVTR